MPPYVSCLMPTYGRAPDRLHLLAEAVESFLRQDYPARRRELVILSDAPSQTLACDGPGVGVAHWPYRIASLGGKYNTLVALARGDVLLPWEDDDLALPHRVSQAVDHLGAAPYWNPHAAWYWPAGGNPVRDHGGVCHNASAFTRAAWLAAGGYPPASGNQDALFDAALRRLGPPAPPLRPDEVPAYVYRWGVGDHLSGHADHEAHWRAVGRRPVAAGSYQITPFWARDYAALLDDPAKASRRAARARPPDCQPAVTATPPAAG